MIFINEITFEALEEGFRTIKEGGLFDNVRTELEMINIHEDDSPHVMTGLVRTYLDYVQGNTKEFNFTTETRHYNLMLNHSQAQKEPFGDIELSRQDLLVNKITDVMSVGIMMIRMRA